MGMGWYDGLRGQAPAGLLNRSGECRRLGADCVVILEQGIATDKAESVAWVRTSFPMS